ncbi:MAG: hypothetical protein ACP5Q1_05970 [Anaerolineae bacterium]
METQRSGTLEDEHLYGQALYPVAPFSWLVPLWFLLCGVVASAGWTWTGNSVLHLFLGFLLAGPLLGTAWGASARVRPQTGRWNCLSGDRKSDTVFALPYTLTGSASSRFAARLSSFAVWWQETSPVVRKACVQLIASSVFSLAVAAQLGQQSLAITAFVLMIAYAIGLSRGKWVYNPVISISVPLCLAWLLGHTAFATLHPVSAVVAASFALVFGGCFTTNHTGQGLIGQVVPQAVVAASLVACHQPIAAMAITLLGSPQLLLAQLLRTPEHRARYFRAIQWHLAVGTLLTAAALGYRI